MNVFYLICILYLWLFYNLNSWRRWL